MNGEVNIESREMFLKTLNIMMNRAMARTIKLKEDGLITQEDFDISSNFYLYYQDNKDNM